MFLCFYLVNLVEVLGGIQTSWDPFIITLILDSQCYARLMNHGATPFCLFIRGFQ